MPVNLVLGNHDERGVVQALQGKSLVNLGSWTFFETTFALWQEGKIFLRDYKRRCTVETMSYGVALSSKEIPGMEEWWRRYYRGFFRYDIEAVRRDRAPIETTPLEEWAVEREPSLLNEENGAFPL